MIQFWQMLRKYYKNSFYYFLVAVVALSLQSCSGVNLKPWHTERLDEEFTRRKVKEVQSFEDYLQLEDRLFKELDEKIYAQSNTGPTYKIDRYSPGSLADPRKRQPNWNHSFELNTDKPRGGVLLLHGMSDSPYSLLTIGKILNKHGYWVIGMRMPGHGTAPSGLRFINRHDMTAAVRLGMAHLIKKVKGKPIHIIGYSTGAPLALEFTLDALKDKNSQVPASIVLISPAIGVHPVAALAGFQNWLGNLPGLGGLAYVSVQLEFDPYKYNSFATNAGSVVYRLARSVSKRIGKQVKNNPEVYLPPILALQSTVDATVNARAVVNNLLKHAKPDRHELVLFDINRFSVVKSRIIIDNPAPLTDRVMADDKLPFKVTLITNENDQSTKLVSKTKQPFSATVSETKNLKLAWPPGVISLSHIALPISPDDPLYGQRDPGNKDFLFLGKIDIQGERGLLEISPDWLLRLRYNPFYEYLESRVLDWIDAANDSK